MAEDNRDIQITRRTLCLGSTPALAGWLPAGIFLSTHTQVEPEPQHDQGGTESAEDIRQERGQLRGTALRGGRAVNRRGSCHRINA